MKQVRKYIYMVIIALMGFALVITFNGKRVMEKRWKDAMVNVKAYDELSSTTSDNSRAFRLTIDQLKYSNDSIVKELDKARKELKVKDSKLKSLQYLSSEFTKTDTIIMRDTIFRSREVDIDTLLSDEWYSVRVGLKYPSSVTVTPRFRSVKSIVVSSKRETVNPPKRFFLFRWFQKRHTVLNVKVIEKNPYVQNQDNKFIEIVR